MSFVGQKLGPIVYMINLTKFGIGQKTGIDLQVNLPPNSAKKGTWSDVDLATASFGQGVA